MRCCVTQVTTDAWLVPPPESWAGALEVTYPLGNREPVGGEIRISYAYHTSVHEAQGEKHCALCTDAIAFWVYAVLFNAPPTKLTQPNFIWKGTPSARNFQSWVPILGSHENLDGLKEEDLDCKSPPSYPGCILPKAWESRATIFWWKAWLPTSPCSFSDRCNMEAMEETYNQDLPLPSTRKEYPLGLYLYALLVISWIIQE